MSVDKSEVTNTAYTWKSQFGGTMHIDSQEIEVFPGEPEFKQSVYHCVVEACQGGLEHKIGIKLSLESK